MIPRLNAPKNTPITRPMSAFGAVLNRYDIMAAKNTAEPAPPAARNSTSNVKVGATAARPEDTPTTKAPVATMARSPKRSTSAPQPRSISRRVNAKAETSTPTAS